jgi:hypothetical protein
LEVDQIWLLITGDILSWRNSIRQQRMLKMITIADDRHFIYDNEIELVQFIASEMEKEGLDLNNEENLDSYLDTQFM